MPSYVLGNLIQKRTCKPPSRGLQRMARNKTKKQFKIDINLLCIKCKLHEQLQQLRVRENKQHNMAGVTWGKTNGVKHLRFPSKNL
jgi:hypothetical protein